MESVANILSRILRSIFKRDIGLLIFFFCNVFVRLWYLRVLPYRMNSVVIFLALFLEKPDKIAFISSLYILIEFYIKNPMSLPLGVFLDKFNSFVRNGLFRYSFSSC